MKKLDIKRALAEHNMSQIELCQKIGVAQQNMSAIVRSGNPTVAKLMQIAEGIGCDITDLFYPGPAEEAEERKKAIESAKNSKMPLELILRDLTRRAYPSITKEEIDEWIEVIRKKNMVPWFDMGSGWSDLPEGIISRDVKFVQKAADEPAYQVHENGLVSENQQEMMQTSTFCPHCGQKVRVGVVLLPEQC